MNNQSYIRVTQGRIFQAVPRDSIHKQPLAVGDYIYKQGNPWGNQGNPSYWWEEYILPIPTSLTCL